MRIVVIVDSNTGNTFEVARAVADELAYQKSAVMFMETEEVLDQGLPYCDAIFACSWVDRSNWSPNMKKIVPLLADKPVAIVATAGWLQGDYPAQIEAKMRAELPESATFLGFFVCQGKLRESTRERYLSGEHARATTPEEIEIKLKNWEESQNHPNDDDIENAQEFARVMLQKAAALRDGAGE